MKSLFKRSLAPGPGSLTLGAILVVVTLFALGVPILELIELKAYDLRFQVRGDLRPSPAIVVAAIDEKSLEVEGRWPWPRSKIATLVNTLSRDGARVIGFDIAFTEPDENSELALIGELAKTVDAVGVKNSRLAQFIDERRRQADNDRALATAIKESSAAVVLGYFFHRSQADLDYRLEPGELDRRRQRLSTSRYPIIVSREPDLSLVPFMKAYAPQPNLDILAEPAASSGYFSGESDRDGVVRRMPLAIQSGDDLFPSLAVLCAWHYLGRPELVVRAGRYGVEAIQMGDRVIPTDESGQLLVNYMGPLKTFPYLSITEILRGRIAPGTFKDRVVLVGATAVGTHDLRSTPLSPVYPGTEIHATVIDNVLTQRFLAKPRWSKIFDLLAIVSLTGLVGIALRRMGALKALLLAAGLFVLYVAFAVGLFVRLGLWLNIVYPLLGLTLNYTTLTAYRYVTEERERKRIKGTFRQYVAPLVVEEMLKDPRRLKLGGEEKVLTVLFSDLEGFTSYSERYPPREMIEILSEYYGRVTEQIFAHRGTLKEYVGDELMAFFGAPFEQPDHAERACAAALAMREQRLALNAEWQSIGRPRLKTRTGINSGPMLVGNLGSKYRFAYGVLGDHVNLGSRLEGLNRVYRTEILVGENTALLVGQSFLLREIDLVRMKGKQQPVRVYELLARSGAALPPEHEKALALHASGLEAYHQRRWDEALSLFDQALAIWPADGPSRTMAERCRIYREVPPPEEWDGVFEQTLESLKAIG